MEPRSAHGPGQIALRWRCVATAVRSSGLVALVLACGQTPEPARAVDPPAPSDVEPPTRVAAVSAPPAAAIAAAHEAPPPTLADPELGSESVTVVARIVGLPKRMPPACGRGYFSIFVEYEVVEVEAGTIAGTRFFALHGCPDMLRTRLKSLAVGDVHRIELSTSAKYRRGMALPPKPRPPFYSTKHVEKI